MSRLIEANALYTSYCNLYEGKVSDGELDRVAHAIASAPTIDPESLRPRGRWIDIGKNYYTAVSVQNVERSTISVRPTAQTAARRWRTAMAKTFCVNCGCVTEFAINSRRKTIQVRGVQFSYRRQYATCRVCSEGVYVPSVNDANVGARKRAYMAALAKDNTEE